MSMWDETPAKKYYCRRKLYFNMKKGQEPLKWNILDRFLIVDVSIRIISRSTALRMVKEATGSHIIQCLSKSLFEVMPSGGDNIPPGPQNI